jgi:hypothetical protein
LYIYLHSIQEHVSPFAFIWSDSGGISQSSFLFLRLFWRRSNVLQNDIDANHFRDSCFRAVFPIRSSQQEIRKSRIHQNWVYFLHHDERSSWYQYLRKTEEYNVIHIQLMNLKASISSYRLPWSTSVTIFFWIVGIDSITRSSLCVIALTRWNPSTTRCPFQSYLLRQKWNCI